MVLRRHPKSPYWHYDFTLGSRRFRGSTETEAREIAQAVEAKYRSDILLGTLRDRKPTMSLDIAFGRYLVEHANRLPSADDIAWHGAAILAALGKTTALHEIADSNLAHAVARWRGKLADSSVNRRLTVLRAVLRMAADRWGAEVRMPNWKAHWLREPAPRDRYLSPSEADRLIEAAAPHLRAPIAFSLLTGVRLSNCVRLDWSEIDMRTREITMRVKSKTPGGKPHTLPMSEAVFVLLANLGPQDRGAVFRYQGRAIKSFRTSWGTALRDAAIRDFRFHDLRHTAASWMVQAGVPLDVVQKVLGHENIQTTQRYAHREGDAKRKALDAIQSTWRHTADFRSEIPKVKLLKRRGKQE